MEVKEIKIKYQGKLTEATIEVVNGVMIVSPKEEKVDITKFNDGDVITCGWDGSSKRYNWTCILCGEIEYISDNMFIDDYCSLDCEGEFLDHSSGSDSATWVRYATEEEKKLLFDKISWAGLKWDAEKKELVKLKWKPQEHKEYYSPYFDTNPRESFICDKKVWCESLIDEELYERCWCFKTPEECQELCDRLNKSIEGVKP